MLIQSSFPTLRGRNAGKNPNGSRRKLIDEVLEGWDGFAERLSSRGSVNAIPVPCKIRRRLMCPMFGSMFLPWSLDDSLARGSVQRLENFTRHRFVCQLLIIWE